jgi:hypothetical protein
MQPTPHPESTVIKKPGSLPRDEAGGLYRGLIDAVAFRQPVNSRAGPQVGIGQPGRRFHLCHRPSRRQLKDRMLLAVAGEAAASSGGRGGLLFLGRGGRRGRGGTDRAAAQEEAAQGPGDQHDDRHHDREVQGVDEALGEDLVADAL